MCIPRIAEGGGREGGDREGGRRKDGGKEGGDGRKKCVNDERGWWEREHKRER